MFRLWVWGVGFRLWGQELGAWVFGLGVCLNPKLRLSVYLSQGLGSPALDEAYRVRQGIGLGLWLAVM